MYIIGNSETYTQIPMWSEVIKLLKDAGNMGPSLPLCCPQHPDTSISVSTPDDFLRKAPEGGCAVQCGLQLDCGHLCTYKCHSETRHQSVICREPCERLHGDCGHLCTRYVHFRGLSSLSVRSCESLDGVWGGKKPSRPQVCPKAQNPPRRIYADCEILLQSMWCRLRRLPCTR